MSNAERITPVEATNPEPLQLVEPSPEAVVAAAPVGILRANLPIVCSAVSTLFFFLSFVAKRKKMPARSALFSVLGTAAASAGGYFGTRTP